MPGARKPADGDIVLGFRPHTGWSAAVAVSAKDLRVLERRRIAYEPHAEATRFLYHRAAEIDRTAAPGLIAKGREAAVAAARMELRRLVGDLAGKRVLAAAIPAGNTRLPQSLADILDAHSRIHAAEGAFYRETLGEACRELGLSVFEVPERDLRHLAAEAMKCNAAGVDRFLRDLGKSLGPPWAEDQKLATLAAIVAARC